MAGKGSAPGERRGGRVKGTPNKLTATVKAGIQAAYTGIGGNATFTAWAKANPTEFYTKIWTKLVPHEHEVAGPDGEPITINHHYAPEPPA